MSEIEIIGLEKVLRFMDDWLDHAKAAVGDATAASLLNIQSKAKIDSPVDTGRLRAANQIRVDGDRFGGEVYNDVSYAGFVHDGTRFMAARPFLYNAWDDEVPKWIEALGRAISEFKT